MSTDANTVVESSPTAEVAVPEQSLESLSEEQYSNWQLTGDFPEAKPETPPTSTKTEAPAEAGEPKGNQEAGKGKGVKARIPELDADIQELEARLARKADLKRQLESEPGEKPGTPPAETKPAELKAPVKPNVDDFDTWEKYEAAKDKYVEDLADYRVKVAIQADRKERAEEAQKQQQEAEQKTVADRWNKQIKAAAEKHSDWKEAAQALSPYLNPREHPEFKAGATFLLESEAGAEVAHYLGTHLDEAESIAAMTPIRQIAALTRIEDSLTKPAQSVKPSGPKKVTETPPPPTDLGARNALPPDPVQAALDADDTEAYIAAANARDIAAIAAGRRR